LIIAAFLEAPHSEGHRNHKIHCPAEAFHEFIKLHGESFTQANIPTILQPMQGGTDLSIKYGPRPQRAIGGWKRSAICAETSAIVVRASAYLAERFLKARYAVAAI
jgi:hypothetical protein